MLVSVPTLFIPSLVSIFICTSKTILFSIFPKVYLDLHRIILIFKVFSYPEIFETPADVLCCPAPGNRFQIHIDILKSPKCPKLWEVLRKILNDKYMKKVNRVNPNFKLAKISDGILYLMKMGYRGPDDGVNLHFKHRLYKGKL